MYADLCHELSKELPSFPPPPGSDKPLTFIQILLNTCQDEFEGAEAAKDDLVKVCGLGRMWRMLRYVRGYWYTILMIGKWLRSDRAWVRGRGDDGWTGAGGIGILPS